MNIISNIVLFCQGSFLDIVLFEAINLKFAGKIREQRRHVSTSMYMLIQFPFQQSLKIEKFIPIGVVRICEGYRQILLECRTQMFPFCLQNQVLTFYTPHFSRLKFSASDSLVQDRRDQGYICPPPLDFGRIRSKNCFMYH